MGEHCEHRALPSITQSERLARRAMNDGKSAQCLLPQPPLLVRELDGKTGQFRSFLHGNPLHGCRARMDVKDSARRGAPVGKTSNHRCDPARMLGLQCRIDARQGPLPLIVLRRDQQRYLRFAQ